MTNNTMTDNTMTDNTMTDNTMTDTAYDRAIHNMKSKTSVEGQINMESWKTLMMKNIRTTKYKMSDLVI